MLGPTPGWRSLTAMIRIVRAFRSAAALLILLTAALAAPVRADPPLWRAKGGAGEVAMFGSVHLLSEATHWKTARLSDALAHADEVWFEIPLDPASQSAAGNEALRLGLLPAEQSLSKLLPPDLWTTLAATSQALGVDPARLERPQPWLAEITTATTYLARRGAQESLGVERQLYNSAPATAVKKAFETPAEQIGFFA